MLQKYWFYLVALFSVVALASAFIAEFYFNLAPCEMCLKQREPYYVIILGFILIAILRWQDRIWFYLSVQILSVYGLFYSIWHVGIELKIFESPPSCAGDLNYSDSTKEIKEQNSEDFFFDQDIDYNEGIRSPGWARLQRKKLKKIK